MNYRRLLFMLDVVAWQAACLTEGCAWEFPECEFRVKAVVRVGLYAGKEAVGTWRTDWGDLLTPSGVSGSVDVNSFRVLEEQDDPRLRFRPNRFVADPNLPTSVMPRGELSWPLGGSVLPLERREYWIYFERATSLPRSPSFGAEQWGPISPPTNLLRNSGFEVLDPADPAAPQDWLFEGSKVGHRAVEVVQGVSRSGRRSLRLTSPGGSSAFWQYHIPLKPGTLYRLSAWVRASKTNDLRAPRIRLTANLRRADGQPIRSSRASIVADDWPQTETWQFMGKRGCYPYGSTIPTPADTAMCHVRIDLVPSTGEGASEVFVDDVELVEVRRTDLLPPIGVEVSRLEVRPVSPGPPELGP